ncbi:ATP-dependent DNA helicase RecQ [bacterium HR33]|nr:ATP-dependent DNA helicase RecQ [bacterium HR33]
MQQRLDTLRHRSDDARPPENVIFHTVEPTHGFLQDTAAGLVQRLWGYGGLRGLQRKVVLAVLRGRDCLAVLPTGAGKSLCYQVPALLLPGLTVVVSPLISLMQDQVAGLRARGIAAAYLSSTQSPKVRRAVWRATLKGAVRLLYVAPERLHQLRALGGRVSVSLLAVDEAHCISEWGHEFRPSYRTIGRYRRLLGRPRTVALTATATPKTREDIIGVLGLERPVLAIASFDRPNLYFEVHKVADERSRFEALTSMLRGLKGSAIVYLPTRNRTDGIAKVLRQRGFNAAPYHAGLPGPARRALLARFQRGEIDIMVATSAFGMGIDKPDVRLVVHLGVPVRPEAYYQEAGRAGRDGKPARCVLIWAPYDLELASLFTQGPSHKKSEALQRAFDTMRRYASGRECRRKLLLGYLGEGIDRCSGCDRCIPENSAARTFRLLPRGRSLQS